MTNNNGNEPLSREDYEEPRCLLNMNNGKQDMPLRTVPMGRIIEKLDEYLGQDDWGSAERHLDYWLADALSGGDKKGALAIQGERMGLFRKRGREEEALKTIDEALILMDEADMSDTITGATTYVNIATVYKTFSRAEKALPYFAKAQTIYEKHFDKPDNRLGGLYNNMALALTDLSRFEEARSYYEKALDIMKDIPQGELEMAVTYLNMADLEAAERGVEAAEEIVQELLDKARKLLDTPSLPRDGYYAYVLMTCAPTFRYYGRFMDAEELEAAAQAIYKENRQ